MRAGLHEVLISERHSQLLDGLAGKLDVDAGLAAIVPPAAAPIMPMADQQDFIDWAKSALAAMPLPHRLRLRAIYAHGLGSIGDLARAAAKGGMYHPLLSVFPTLRTEFESAFFDKSPSVDAAFTTESYRSYLLQTGLPRDTLPGSSGSAPDEAPSEEAAERLLEKFKSWRDNAVGRLNPPPLRSRHLPWAARAWAEQVSSYLFTKLDNAETIVEWMFDAADNRRVRPVLHWMNQFASDLEALQLMLNDFIDADFRDVDLRGVSLDGVRWSAETTRWPDNWREQIERDSVPVGDDVFEIRYGTNTHQDSLV
ncbi:hypothetical protein [Nocardia sp. NPDC003726]